MKKLLLLFVLVMLSCNCVFAQMILHLPQWEKFVKITTNNIPLRKTPALNSSKLLVSGEETMYPTYSWKAEKGYTTSYFEVGTILPVIKETEEWYCLYFGNDCYGNLMGSYEVYVMKKFCREVTPEAFSKADYAFSENELVNGSKGYSIGVYYLGSPSVRPWCRIGNKIGKYLVMANFEGGMEFVQRFFEGDYSYQEFNINKVRESDLKSFFKSTKVPAVHDIWVKFAGEEEPQKFVVDISSYAHPFDVYIDESEETNQPEKPEVSSNEPIYDVAEQMPSFPGGIGILMKWLSSNISNPNKYKGRVVVKFVVETDGSISNVSVIRGLNQQANDEVVRVIKAMPRWTPGYRKGKPVRVRYSLPVIFS